MLASLNADQRLDACGDDPSPICEWVADRTTSGGLAHATDLLVDLPLQVLLIVIIAIIASRLGRRLVTRAVRRLAARSVRGLSALDRQRRNGRFGSRPGGGDGAGDGDNDDDRAIGDGDRLHLRIDTLAAVAGSLVTAAVWSVAFVVTLGLFNINLAPLFAGAGVVGIAIGFGAQSVVADFLSGFFMLFEDQYGVGDVIDLGDASGTVEKFSLRTTTVRDVNGTVWHVPNSEIRRVGNKSQVWSRAVLDIDVAYDTDLRRAEGIIQRVADELWQDAEFTGGDIIDPPEVWGVERLGADGVTIRLVVKTDPAEQWMVARELRLRIKEALDEAGIEIPFPQRTVWVRQDETIPREARPPVGLAPLRPPVVSDDMVENPDG